VKYLIYFDVEVHDHEVAGKLQVATVRNIYSLQIEIESKAADWVGGGRGGTTIGAGGMYPHLFSNRSVFTVLTSPPTFQCIHPHLQIRGAALGWRYEAFFQSGQSSMLLIVGLSNTDTNIRNKIS